MRFLLIIYVLSCLKLMSLVNARILSMFQITDLHQDNDYSRFGIPGDLRCHKPMNGTLGNLSLAGDYRCDSPPVLVSSAIKYMKKINPNPDIIIWTGDSNPHWIKGPDFDYIFSNLKSTVKHLKNTFPDAIIIPALGNHDTNPPDQYPDFKKSNYSNEFYSSYIEKGAFGDLIKNESRETFKKCGYYSYEPIIDDLKLKFIVLNTNLYYGNNENLDPKDPCSQLEWLENQLVNTDDETQVFIMAHIPPGYFERNTDVPFFDIDNGDHINNEFLRIFTNRTLAPKISAHFYGHTHTDSFKLFMNPTVNGEVSGIAFIAPSVTPALYVYSKSIGVNPSLRIYEYNTQARLVKDYKQYYLDLNEAQMYVEDIDEVKDRRGRNSKYSRAKRNDDSSEIYDDNDRDESAQVLLPSTTTQLPDATTIFDTTTTTNDDIFTSEQLNIKETTTFEETTTTNPQQGIDIVQGITVVDSSTDASVSLDVLIIDKLINSWKFNYLASKSFGVISLSEKNMYQVYKKMKDPQSSIFRRYYKHNTANHILPGDQSCVGVCHTEMICSITKHTKNAMRKCLIDQSSTNRNSNDNTNPTTDKVTTTKSTPKPTIILSTVKPALKKRNNLVPDNHYLRGIAIGFSTVVVLAIALAGIFFYRKVQKNRYRSQEFLLNDSVFRYSGYAQVEET